MKTADAKRRDVLARIEARDEAIRRAQEYLRTGDHAQWSGFRALFAPKRRDGKELPPHPDWVRNVYLRRMEKARAEAEAVLERLDRRRDDVRK